MKNLDSKTKIIVAAIVAFSLIGAALFAFSLSYKSDYMREAYVPSQTPSTYKLPQRIQYGSSTSYISKLGVRFIYVQPFWVKEEGNVIALYGPENESYSQRVEVFSKFAEESLESAIRRMFLKEYPRCLLQKIDNSLDNDSIPKGYEAFHLFPPTKPDGKAPELDDWEWMKTVCPDHYTGFGGIGYFLADKDHYDKFAYFSLGNGVTIPANTEETWVDTFKFY